MLRKKLCEACIVYKNEIILPVTVQHPSQYVLLFSYHRYNLKTNAMNTF